MKRLPAILQFLFFTGIMVICYAGSWTSELIPLLTIGGLVLGALGYYFWRKWTISHVRMDLGQSLQRYNHLCSGILNFLLGCCFYFSDTWKESAFSDIFAAVLLLWSMRYIILATERFLITEQGIWAYAYLLKWHRIKEYRWEAGPKLVVYGGFPYGESAVKIRRDQRMAVQALLDERCPPEVTLHCNPANDYIPLTQQPLLMASQPSAKIFE